MFPTGGFLSIEDGSFMGECTCQIPPRIAIEYNHELMYIGQAPFSRLTPLHMRRPPPGRPSLPPSFPPSPLPSLLLHPPCEPSQ